ncbi:MAG: HmuY family protein [Polyangiaceae bacterium]
MKSRALLFTSAVAILCAGPGCSGSDTNSSGGGGAGTTTTTDTGGAGGGTTTSSVSALCTTPTPVACEDQVILDMDLQKPVTPGLITNEADGAGWKSGIDATAGGAFASTPDSYTYGKFTDAGLTKVDLGDQDAIGSMDWDIAFRRYVARINSGDSGPSCVQAAPVPGGKKYEEVTALPDSLSYHADDYFTDTCDFIPDGSGLMNSPATALSAYWSYPGCVKMSGQVFVLELASGRHVKLIVDDYYSPDIQTQCDTTGSVPMGNTGSANFIVRWSFLD